MVAFVFSTHYLYYVTQHPYSLREVRSITEAGLQRAERMSLQERGQDTDREFIKIACKVGNLRRLTSVSPENTGVKSGTRPVTIKTPANSIC